jgi:hypothetical protein
MPNRPLLPNTATRKDTLPQVSAESIQTHWARLCLKIGDRRAGSAGDKAAAEYVLAQFRALGLQSVHGEPFPCRSVAHAEAVIEFCAGEKWRRVPARVLAGSPSTQSAGLIETDLVWVEMPEQARRLRPRQLKGKIVVLFGPMPTRADLHRRLVVARPAAVLHVDDRLPFSWVKDDGVYPVWAQRYGMPPTASMPYRAAWDLRRSGAARARVRIAADLKNVEAHNLIGEISGRRPELPLVLIGAHHDTQCNNSGADDNGSGVVALLELARLLASSGFLRTIRFVSFGAEEQLSVGSACYARAHLRDISKVGVVLNLDSVSSPLGHHWVLRAGTDEFGDWLMRRLERHGLEAVQKSWPMPFADHFPFSALGVPSVTLMRPNMDGGMRWQHHSAHDNLRNVSVEELARVIHAVRGVAINLARTSRWPFGRGVAPQHRTETDRLARELFGLRRPASHATS